MKNKNKCCSTSKCCTKMSGTNIFIGCLMGLAILVFGGKMILSQNPIPEPQILDSSKIDQMLEKNSDKVEEGFEFAGTWKTEGEDGVLLILSEDGTIPNMEGNLKWNAEGNIITLTNADGVTTETFKLVDGNLVDGETVYKK